MKIVFLCILFLLPRFLYSDSFRLNELYLSIETNCILKVIYPNKKEKTFDLQLTEKESISSCFFIKRYRTNVIHIESFKNTHIVFVDIPIYTKNGSCYGVKRPVLIKENEVFLGSKSIFDVPDDWKGNTCYQDYDSKIFEIETNEILNMLEQTKK